MKNVTHGILTVPFNDPKGFCNELSEKVIEGWTVVSSGLDGVAGGWWAIIQKVED